MEEAARQRMVAIVSELKLLRLQLDWLRKDAEAALARDDPETAAAVAERITSIQAEIRALGDEWVALTKRA
jgi:hypothetical protein